MVYVVLGRGMLEKKNSLPFIVGRRGLYRHRERAEAGTGNRYY